MHLEARLQNGKSRDQNPKSFNRTGLGSSHVDRSRSTTVNVTAEYFLSATFPTSGRWPQPGTRVVSPIALPSPHGVGGVWRRTGVDGAPRVGRCRGGVPGRRGRRCRERCRPRRSAGGAATGRRERLDASGCIVIPGLVNAHHHLLQSAFRTAAGHPSRAHGPLAGDHGGYYRQARVDPELTAAAAAVGVAEGLLAGVTTVADHHLTWPAEQDPLELAGATIAAAAGLGSRLVFVRGTAGDDPEMAATSTEALVARHGAGEPTGCCRSPAVPRACTPTARRRSPRWPRWRRGTVSAAAPRPTSRWTSSGPRRAGVAAPSTSSTSGVGWPTT